MNDSLKYKAAVAALDEVSDGMAVGLGTGSTVTHFIRELGNRIRQGLNVTAIATSLRSESLALEVGIPIVSFRECPLLDLTVDGADEVSPELHLIKGMGAGRGGAVVRRGPRGQAGVRVPGHHQPRGLARCVGRSGPRSTPRTRCGPSRPRGRRRSASTECRCAGAPNKSSTRRRRSAPGTRSCSRADAAIAPSPGGGPAPQRCSGIDSNESSPGSAP